jgi:hypothetical protein
MTAKITEFVFVGKTFLSIERAAERQKQPPKTNTKYLQL